MDALGHQSAGTFPPSALMAVRGLAGPFRPPGVVWWRRSTCYVLGHEMRRAPPPKEGGALAVCLRCGRRVEL